LIIGPFLRTISANSETPGVLNKGINETLARIKLTPSGNDVN
jgi:hypothetical protein